MVQRHTVVMTEADIWSPLSVGNGQFVFSADVTGLQTLASFYETADFMASYAHWGEDKRQYDLGPPLIPAQENHKYAVTKNPTYELEYWQWALDMAQQWRSRLGLARVEHWDRVIAHLAPLPVGI